MQIKRFKRLYRAIEEGIGTVCQHHDKKAVKKWIAEHRDFLTENIRTGSIGKAVKYSKTITLP